MVSLFLPYRPWQVRVSETIAPCGWWGLDWATISADHVGRQKGPHANRGRKCWLLSRKQMQHLKPKGVRFDLISEGDAAAYLTRNNYYFRPRLYPRTGCAQAADGKCNIESYLAASTELSCGVPWRLANVSGASAYVRQRHACTTFHHLSERCHLKVL